jgi:hypothetical protein
MAFAVKYFHVSVTYVYWRQYSKVTVTGLLDFVHNLVFCKQDVLETGSVSILR